MLGQTHIANNLNQIAYHANRGTLLLDEAAEAEIKETCGYIAFMRVELIEALGTKGGQ
ncbi:plasmid mobilization relaxosome protein MobC [uncultured Hoeflea sp.]|uniref:plasmid mobilization relaxosome protein MobC n=1 Tax=uncultured Hoeflea sp. TaxID=538666 RepID=UPI0026162F60|nr:plasmid mobilization relaxosome protein MobC [uncultured Hoeflea sp.]